MSSCPFVKVLDPETYVKGMPHGDLAVLREHGGGVVKLDDSITGVPYWVVSRRDDIDFVSKNPKLFSSAQKSSFPMEVPDDVMPFMNLQFINMDPPNHVKYRKIVRRAFTPTAVNSYREHFKQHVTQMLNKVVAKGECEFVTEVAAELPLIAILELLGVPLEDREKMFDLTNTMMFADDPDMQTSEEEGMLASVEVLAYAHGLAKNHRANPRSQLLSGLLDGSVDGDALTDDEFGWTFILMMVGGNESTRSVTSQGMRLLIEHPDQLQYLVENPDKISNAVEEMLRYSTAFSVMRRTATQDVELGGELISKGDKVIIQYHSANHDPRVFGEDAAHFDVRRAERMPDLYNQHRAFGIGQHFCIGSHLARLELNLVFEQVIPRLRNPELVTEVKAVRSYFINGIKEMHIKFDKQKA